MNWDAVDWTALGRLRREFLSGSMSGRDYWHRESDLASYDATFAQRIGWKWDYVLAELTRRGWVPPMSELLDWGCGSGIAGRAFLDHFGTKSVTGLRVWDRSPLALKFAAKRARVKYPGLKVFTGIEVLPAANSTDATPPIEPRLPFPIVALRNASEGNEKEGKGGGGFKARRRESPQFVESCSRGEDRGIGGQGHGVVLLSHVLTELTPEQTESLLDLVVGAQCVLWVEPGTHEASRRLIVIRERLRDRFNIIAPCTHSASCGMLVPGNERHWCHHFATPPREIFTDSNWSRFARITGIDLRDLPLSFLILDRRPAPPVPAGTGCVIGHPRIYKAHALLLGCDATGVRERLLNQRRLPAEFRNLKKSAVAGGCVWECPEDEILAIRPLAP